MATPLKGKPLKTNPPLSGSLKKSEERGITPPLRGLLNNPSPPHPE